MIYPSLPDYAPPLWTFMRPSQNPPLLNIPPPFKHLYATLTESTHPSRNEYPPFLTNIGLYETPIIYPSFPEYTQFYIKWCSQNLPLPSRIYPPFPTTIGDAPRIYPALQESTPSSRNIGLPLPLAMRPHRIYLSLQNTPPS